jgi:hypothetical protein
MKNLNNKDYSRNSIPGLPSRLFDIKKKVEGSYIPCEIGVDRSGRGNYSNRFGTPNNMGIHNKFFLDHVKTFVICGSRIAKSLSYLFFIIEDGADLKKSDKMFKILISVLPKGLPYFYKDVLIGDDLIGKVLIIDELSFSEVKIIYKSNTWFHKYVNPIECGIQKHLILMK